MTYSNSQFNYNETTRVPELRAVTAGQKYFYKPGSGLTGIVTVTAVSPEHITISYDELDYPGALRRTDKINISNPNGKELHTLKPELIGGRRKSRRQHTRKRRNARRRYTRRR
jgi:hypothetical protein